MELYDIITPKALASYWEIKRQYLQPYYGEELFPDKKKLGIDLSFIKGARKNPVQLSLSAFDVPAIPLSRKGLTQLIADMPFFKNVYDIDEKLRQELNKVIDNGSDMVVNALLENVFDDETRLLENARLTKEIMRMQILTTGVLSMANNGQTYSYDYGVPVSHKVAPTIKWDVPATADPKTDLEGWIDLIEQETGIRPARIVMNSYTLGVITKCDSIKNAVYVLGDGKVVPSKDSTKAYLENELKVTIEIYSKGYTDETTGNFTKFIPDGTVVIMPEGTLGNTYMGTTPEESDLMRPNSPAKVEIVDTGVALTSSVTVDPVKVSTKASMICMPSFEMADQIIIASVLTA